MSPPSPVDIPPSPIALFPQKGHGQVDIIRLSFNREAWAHNSKLKATLAMLDIKNAEKKLFVVDEDLGASIVRGSLKIPDAAITNPVKLLMQKEEGREFVSPFESFVKTERMFQEEYQVDLIRALRLSQVNCVGCLMGVGCEWEGPMGDLLRAHGSMMRAKRPSVTNNQIRFFLYRLYVNRRFSEEIQELKNEGDDEPRIPLPICVETEIKKKYSGGKVAAYVGFKKRRQDNSKKEE
jgi:hypothetical protein